MKVGMFDENLQDGPLEWSVPEDVAQTPLVALARRMQQEQYDQIWVTQYGASALQKQSISELELVWESHDFLHCLGVLHKSWQPIPQILVQAVGHEAIVLQRVERFPRSCEDWILEKVVSDLAMRTLSAALRLGRNILWTGPKAICRALMLTLAAQGQRPVILAPRAQTTLPEGFTALGSIAEAQAYGADAIVIDNVIPMAALHDYLTQLSQTQAWIEAGRLERALMRFEWHTQRSTTLVQPEQAALAVLAGIDLVVVVQPQDGIRITQICELVLAESGYQPLPLFRTGHRVAPQALIPVAIPSFTEQLAFCGLEILAEDLRHSVGLSQPAPAQTDSAPIASGPASPDAGPVGGNILRRGASASAAPRAFVAQHLHSDRVSQPGWELDRLLGDESPLADEEPTLAQQPPETPKAPAEVAAASQAAALAAQFGLGPPPAPLHEQGQRQQDATQISKPRQEEGTTFADVRGGRHLDKK